jgi:hypothetical protein
MRSFRSFGCWLGNLEGNVSSETTVAAAIRRGEIAPMGGCINCGANYGKLHAPWCGIKHKAPMKPSPLPTGYAERKALPLYDFMFKYFPLAWLEVVKVAVAGNAQHNPGEPLHWAREKSTDQLNTAFRHLFDHGMGEQTDTDGCYHLAKAIWRLSAELQLIIEKKSSNPTGNGHETQSLSATSKH